MDRGADTSRASTAGLQTGSRPCFRGVLTVPFQHVGILSPRTHPTVLVQCVCMSHRPHHSLPSHPEEHAGLPGQRHARRSGPGTASWFVCKQQTPGAQARMLSHIAAPNFLHIWFLAQVQPGASLGQAEQAWGEKVKDAKETSTPTRPVQIF